MSKKLLRIFVWRLISIVLSFILARIFSGSWHIALGLVLTNSIILMLCQATFEHFWDLKFKTESYKPNIPTMASPTSPEAAGNEFT
jgi:cytochrome b